MIKSFKKYIGIGIVIAFAVMLLVMIAYLGITVYKEFNTDINRQLNTLKVYQQKEKELKAIQQTLLVAYPKRIVNKPNSKKKMLSGINKIEAEVYSLIFYNLSNNQKHATHWTNLAALIYIESQYNPTVISKKKAKGISQLLESTGRATAAKNEMLYLSNNSLWHDITNLYIGLTYFCEGLRDDKNLTHAIKRYLGGPNYAKYKYQSSINNYYKRVIDEATKLLYIYKGVKKGK